VPAIAAMAAARKGRLTPCFIVFAALLAGLLLPAPSHAAGPRAKAAAVMARAARAHQREQARRHVRETRQARDAIRRPVTTRPAQRPAASATPTPSPAPPATTSAAKLRFGINGGALLSQPASASAAALSALRAAGASEVRQDLSWRTVEPTDGVFDWTATDAIATTLARQGLRWYALLSYSAPWAATTPGDQMSHPADVHQFAAYAAAAAARYGTGGSFWTEHPELPALPAQHFEIWNEENAARFWREQATAPEDYADLYVTSRTAIRAVDPQAKVVVGGLVGPSSLNFIGRFYSHRSDLARSVDAVAFHPYDTSAGGQLSSIADVRARLDEFDPGVPIELTEAGFSTLDMTDAQRAVQLTKLVSGIAGRPKLHVASLLPYAAITNEGDLAAWEQWFGIFNLDGTPKASGAAYLSAVRAALT
jgi:hypothetical protein